jgi:Undecaprenyl-phosphate galactose phosphotransferase WbaP
MPLKTEFRKLLCLLLLLFTDALALALSFVLAHLIREEILIRLLRLRLRPLLLPDLFAMGFGTAALILLAVFAFERLYVRRYTFWEETRHLLKAVTLSAVLLLIVSSIPGSLPQFPKTIIFSSWLTGLALFPLFRLATKKLFNATGLWRKNVVVLGTNPVALAVADEIRKNDSLCYRVVGFLSDGPRPEEGPTASPHIIGTIADLDREMCLRYEIKDIFIALPDCPQERLIEISKTSENLAETIKIVPSIGSLYAMGVEIENTGDIISVSVARNLIKPWNRFVKRLFEIVLSLGAIVIWLPFFGLIALAVKLDSAGPAIYVQERLGKKDRPFRIFKFRSMYVDNQARLADHFRRDPGLRKEWDIFRKLKTNDPRVTRVGRVLRRWSLDETPQLFNVLRGEMSLVGPRPFLPEETRDALEPGRLISSVPPGLTGLWQVRGRNALTFRDRLYLDEYYIRNWSPWLDIVILLKTVKALVQRRGAF